MGEYEALEYGFESQGEDHLNKPDTFTVSKVDNLKDWMQLFQLFRSTPYLETPGFHQMLVVQFLTYISKSSVYKVTNEVQEIVGGYILSEDPLFIKLRAENKHRADIPEMLKDMEEQSRKYLSYECMPREKQLEDLLSAIPEEVFCILVQGNIEEYALGSGWEPYRTSDGSSVPGNKRPERSYIINRAGKNSDE